MHLRVGIGIAAALISVALPLDGAGGEGAPQPRSHLDRSFGRGGHLLTPGLTPGRVAMDRAGRILTASGSAQALLVSRYLPDGRLDRSFGKGGTAEVSLERFASGPEPEEEREGSGIAEASALAIQGDRRILAAGTMDTDFGQVSVLARLRPGGRIDATFDRGDRSSSASGQRDLGLAVNSILPLRDKIVLAGTTHRAAVWRLERDGGLDPSFGVGRRPGKVALPPPPEGRTHYHVEASFGGVLPGPRGTLFAAGFDLGALLLAQLRRDGALDRHFAGHGMVEVNPSARRGCGCFAGGFLARDGHGRLLIAGSLEARSGTSRHKRAVLARYFADGELDRSFDDGGFVRVGANTATYVNGVLVDREGRVILTGSSAAARPEHGDGPQSFTVIRLLPNGERDPSFFGDGVFKSRFGGSAATATQAVAGSGGDLVVAGAVYHGLRRGRLVQNPILVGFSG